MQKLNTFYKYCVNGRIYKYFKGYSMIFLTIAIYDSDTQLK